jgi:hypothetical protein
MQRRGGRSSTFCASWTRHGIAFLRIVHARFLPLFELASKCSSCVLPMECPKTSASVKAGKRHAEGGCTGSYRPLMHISTAYPRRLYARSQYHSPQPFTKLFCNVQPPLAFKSRPHAPARHDNYTQIEPKSSDQVTRLVSSSI